MIATPVLGKAGSETGNLGLRLGFQRKYNPQPSLLHSTVLFYLPQSSLPYLYSSILCVTPLFLSEVLSLEYLPRSTFSQSSVNPFKLFSPQFDTPESLHPQKPWSVFLYSTTLSNHFHTPHSSGIRGEVHEPAGFGEPLYHYQPLQWSPCQGSVLLMTQELRSGLHPQIHHMTILHQSNENLTKSGKTDTNPYHRIPASYSILHTNHAGSTDDARSPNKPMQNSFSRIIEQDRKHKAAVVPRSIQPHHSGRVSRNLTPPQVQGSPPMTDHESGRCTSAHRLSTHSDRKLRI